MKKIFLFSYIILLPIWGFGQKSEFKLHGFSIGAKAMILFPIPNMVDMYWNEEFQPGDDTLIYGIQSEINYFVSREFALGVGFGKEIVTQPDISYIPIYLNALLILDEHFFIDGKLGVHRGSVPNSGILSRIGLGIPIQITKNLLANFTIAYSFQNIYKDFPNSNLDDNYYNFETIGVSVGIDIR